MSISRNLHHFLSTTTLFSSYFLQQIAPLLVVVVLPLLVLTAHPHLARLFRRAFMVLETLALVLPWNWRSVALSTSSSASERNKLKKKVVRTRADQLAVQGNGDVSVSALAGPSSVSPSFDGFYPGLVNLSGSYCFMNSTLQAMASLAYLQPHIDYIYNKAESLTAIVHTPVVDELRDLLGTLNAPSSSQLAIRPESIITALSRYSHGKHNPLFSSRQHQDAQELFQLVSECIKREIAAVDKESIRDKGLGGIPASGPPGRSRRQIGKSVFDGLTANRRSCKVCGYTEAVMHFAFDNWQLALPRMPYCTLEALLEDYTRLEELDDCICRRCSMQATYERLAYEADKLSKAASTSDASASKKKRAREARSLVTRVKNALDDGRIEEDIKGVQMEKAFSQASTKQAMIARPPPVLVLHLSRSIHYGGSDAARNNCRVAFHEYLDLTPFTTSGQLSTEPHRPISSPPPRSGTPTPATYSYPRYIYRLSAVVCHYGNHYAGHYICYRRKPRPPSAASRRWSPPRFVCPLGCDCDGCQGWGPIRDDWDVQNEEISGRGGGGWLMTSDTHVKEVSIHDVLREEAGAFMLYYERVIPYSGGSSSSHHHQPQSSQGRNNNVARSTPPPPPPMANGPIARAGMGERGSSSSSSTPGSATGGSGDESGTQSNGVYTSTSQRSSEETLRPGPDTSINTNSNNRHATSLMGLPQQQRPGTDPSSSSASASTSILTFNSVPAFGSSTSGPILVGGQASQEGEEERKFIPRVFLGVSASMPQRRATSGSKSVGATNPSEPSPSSSSSKLEASQTIVSAEKKGGTSPPNGDASRLSPRPSTPNGHVVSPSPLTPPSTPSKTKQQPNSPSKLTKLKKPIPPPLISSASSPSVITTSTAAGAASDPTSPTRRPNHRNDATRRASSASPTPGGVRPRSPRTVSSPPASPTTKSRVSKKPRISDELVDR